jgi:hypothetical protein
MASNNSLEPTPVVKAVQTGLCGGAAQLGRWASSLGDRYANPFGSPDT